MSGAGASLCSSNTTLGSSIFQAELGVCANCPHFLPFLSSELPLCTPGRTFFMNPSPPLSSGVALSSFLCELLPSRLLSGFLKSFKNSGQPRFLLHFQHSCGFCTSSPGFLYELGRKRQECGFSSPTLIQSLRFPCVCTLIFSFSIQIKIKKQVTGKKNKAFTFKPSKASLQEISISCLFRVLVNPS